MSKVKSIIILIVTALVVGFFGFACFVSGPVPNSVKDYKSVFGSISKGIDLAGGDYAVLEPNGKADISDSEMSSIMDTIRKRLSDNGFTEASVEKQNSTSIRVEIPEVKNPEDVLKYVGSQGKLEFRDSSGTVWLTGKDIKKAGTGYDENGNPADALYCDVNSRYERIFIPREQAIGRRVSELFPFPMTEFMRLIKIAQTENLRKRNR